MQVQRPESTCKEKCANFQDVKATQQSATHAQTGCCTSFSSHRAGTKSTTAFIRTASGGFLTRGDRNAWFSIDGDTGDL